MANELSISERNTVEKLVEALQALPQVHADGPVWEPAAYGNQVDAKIDVMAGDQRYALLVEAKKDVFPRDVR